MDFKFTIRNAENEDAHAIARVHHLAWLNTYRGLVPDSELDSLEIDALTDQWKQILSMTDARTNTLVAVKGATIIAYSRFYPSVDRDDDQSKVATIGSFYVAPDFQRKGVGGELMRAVLEVVKNHIYMEATLHVLTVNHGARKFYEHLGWEEDLDADIAGSTTESTPKVRYRKNLQ